MPRKIVKPPKAILEHLYFDKHKTTKYIGNRYNCSSVTVLRWFKEDRIVPSRGKGKKIVPPPKVDLERAYLDEMKGSPELAGVYGVTRQTVLKWLHEYKIPIRAGGVSPVELIDKSELERLYVNAHMSSHKVGEMCDCSAKNVLNSLRAHGITVRRKGAISRPGSRRSVCRILKDHAEEFKDDPERLSTAFMQEMLGVECD